MKIKEVSDFISAFRKDFNKNFTKTTASPIIIPIVVIPLFIFVAYDIWGDTALANAKERMREVFSSESNESIDENYPCVINGEVYKVAKDVCDDIRKNIDAIDAPKVETPTPTTKKIQNYPTITPDPDPIIKCRYEHLGIIEMKQSECNRKGECEINGMYVLAESEDECKAKGRQASGNNSNGNSSLVSYTTTEGITNGTYYCYSDKVNEISRLEQDIKLAEGSADICSQSNQSDYQNCYFACQDDTCRDNCVNTYVEKCNHSAIGDMRRDLMNKIYSYCP